MAIERYDPDSTNIDFAEYDPDTRTLTVTFLRDGREYTSENVTPQEWDDFKLAPSAGSFYARVFRNRF